MDFEFFEQLSDDEATAYLDRYLEVESQEILMSIAEAEAAGITADFSVNSVPKFLPWLLKSLKPVVREPGPEMPDWMREAQESVRGFIDIADESSALVLRASYYLGESFVRSYAKLTWTLGRPNTANQHAPVVAGFGDGDELPVMLVAETMSRKMLRSPDDPGIEGAVDAWKEKV